MISSGTEKARTPSSTVRPTQRGSDRLWRTGGPHPPPSVGGPEPTYPDLPTAPSGAKTTSRGIAMRAGLWGRSPAATAAPLAFRDPPRQDAICNVDHRGRRERREREMFMGLQSSNRPTQGACQSQILAQSKANLTHERHAALLIQSEA